MVLQSGPMRLGTSQVLGEPALAVRKGVWLFKRTIMPGRGGEPNSTGALWEAGARLHEVLEQQPGDYSTGGTGASLSGTFYM